MANALENYVTPVETDDPLFSNAAGVPVDPDGVRRVYIDTAPNKLERKVDPTRVATDDVPVIPDNLPGALAALRDYLTREASPGTKVGNRLFGAGGEQRYITWPEKMVRSGLTLPGDVATGREPMLPPGLRREDFTDVPPPQGPTSESPWLAQKLGLRPGVAQPGDTVVERAQDTAGLMGGGAFGATKPGQATLGSGPVLRVARKLPDGEVQLGKPGQIHSDLLTDAELIAGVDKTQNQMGFAMPNGQFLTRDQALEFVNKYEPERAPDPMRGRLEAARYNDALYSDTTLPGAAVSGAAKTAPVFYSAVENAVRSARQPSASAEQWMGFLQNQPGVKPEELGWMGVHNWLSQQKGKVSKEDLQGYLDAHRLEVKDVVKAGDKDPETAIGDRAQEIMDTQHADVPPDTDRWYDLFDQAMMTADNELRGGINGGGSQPKYSQYQLPGGENYREQLLTLPENTKTRAAYRKAIKEGASEEELNRLSDVNNKANPEYRSSHWDEPNVVAHVRMNDRDVGGKKSLHLEEIQSDWHQEGRKKGYKDAVPSKEEITASRQKIDKARVDVGNYVDEELKRQGFRSVDAQSVMHMIEAGSPTPKMLDTPEFARLSKEYKDAWDAHGGLLKKTQGVPDAPFKTTWPELALKRMIRHAAENGYERVSWTPGEAQAARYDLSKHFNNIEAFKGSGTQEGKYTLRGITDKGISHEFGEGITPERLPDLVGKELAEKILSQTEPSKKYSGVDLKVGGEGMIGFYDKMLPKMVEKLGKQHGVKVRQANLNGPTYTVGPAHNPNNIPILDGMFGVYKDGVPIGENHSTKAAAESAVATRQGDHSDKVWYFDLPQSFREQATGKGFPLFAAGVPLPLIPAEDNPWKREKR